MPIRTPIYLYGDGTVHSVLTEVVLFILNKTMWRTDVLKVFAYTKGPVE